MTHVLLSIFLVILMIYLALRIIPYIFCWAMELIAGVVEFFLGDKND